jgi:glycosyltransferase involved in cell wall biosynthesis
VPDVTVVIPTHDRPTLAARAAAMALGQTGVNVEVIVVDNGSDPANADWLAQHIDPRAKLITESRPVGVSVARNIGAELASSDWVAFFDDDDFWASYKLRLQLDALAAAPYSKWCISGTACVDADMMPVISTRMPPQGTKLDTELLKHNVVSMSDIVVRRDVIFACGAFDSSLKQFEDWDFIIRLALQAPCPAVVDRPLSLYSLNPGSATDEIEPMRVALETFAARHEALRQERGVEFDWRAPMFWLAFRMSREGRGADAAMLYRESFDRTRDPRDLAYSFASRWCNRTFVRVLSRLYLARQPRSWRRDIRDLCADVRRSENAQSSDA